jgi:hypothetical protein
LAAERRPGSFYGDDRKSEAVKDKVLCRHFEGVGSTSRAYSVAQLDRDEPH